MSSPGFFYSPEDQDAIAQLQRKQAYARALLQQGSSDPGNQAYGGLRNAGNAILGAFLANKAGKQETSLNQDASSRYTKALGSFLTGNSPQQAPSAPISGANSAPVPSPSPQISNMAGSGPVMAASAPQPQGGPEQAPNAAPPPPQQPQSDIQRLIATGNPALINQFAPELFKHGQTRADEASDYQRDRADKIMRPATPQEKAQAGIDPKTPALVDAFGSIKPITDPNQITAYQQEEIKQSRAQLGETARHNKVEEAVAQNPFGTGLGTPSAPGKTGDDFLGTLPPGLASQIKAVGTYRQPAPAGRTSPTGIKFMTLVNQAYPDYDASSYGAKTKARNDFTTGKNGNTVRSLNVAVQHLDQLGQLSNALGNGNIQLANQLGQSIAQQTGSPAPTNFNAAKDLVGDEIVKAIVGAGGGVADRQKAQDTISRASSPQQLAGVIQTYKGLMAGQLGGLKQQYEKSTGLGDFEDYLAPETKAQLQSHSQSGSTPNAPATLPAGWSVKVK